MKLDFKAPAATVQMAAKDNTHQRDRERLAMFFIFGSVEKFTRIQNHIYDFKEHIIKPECLEEIDFSSSERKLLQLAYNLYNGWECPSIYHMFSSFDEDFKAIAFKAIVIRFNV